MSKYNYRGKTYETKTQLIRAHNIANKTINNLEKEGITLYDALDSILEVREKNLELTKRAEAILGKSFNSRKDLEQYLKTIDFKFEQHSLYKLEDMVLFLEKLYHTPYYFLIVGKGPFLYEGMEFNSLTSFLAYYKIVKPTLFKELVKNEFNVKRSILKCKDDPEFRTTVRPIINNKKYDSVSHLARVYEIHGGTYMTHLRDGLSFEDALTKCLETKNRSQRFNNQFPIEVLGVECNSVEEIATVLNIERKSITTYLVPYDNLEDFILDYGDVYNKQLQADTKKLIMSKYGLASTQISAYLKENNYNLNAVVDKLEMLWFEYNGETLYPSKKYLDKYDIKSPSQVGVLKKLLLSVETKEEKNTTAKNYLDDIINKNKTKIKTSSIFS